MPAFQDHHFVVSYTLSTIRQPTIRTYMLTHPWAAYPHRFAATKGDDILATAYRRDCRTSRWVRCPLTIVTPKSPVHGARLGHTPNNDTCVSLHRTQGTWPLQALTLLETTSTTKTTRMPEHRHRE
ncbi:unnamed protein product [Ectocarpus sp. 6 AP-2014]